MNGATALPPPNTISTASSKSITMRGASQNFLRATINFQISLNNSIYEQK